jgi:hypothetical protein
MSFPRLFAILKSCCIIYFRELLLRLDYFSEGQEQKRQLLQQQLGASSVDIALVDGAGAGLGEGEGAGTDCGVCCEVFDAGLHVRVPVMPCKHVFCASCIVTWQRLVDI